MIQKRTATKESPYSEEKQVRNEDKAQEKSFAN